MELTKYSQAIKNQIADELHKIGSSLQEFEEALQNLNTGEGVHKVAATTLKLSQQVKIAQKDESLLDIKNMMQDTARSLPELAFKTSLAGGALGGLTMDDMDHAVDRLNKSLDREREKLKLIQNMTNNLRREHGFA